MTVAEAWQDTLREAINERYGSLIGYARHRAGEGATERMVQARRRLIGKWLQEVKPSRPSRKIVKELARDLGLDPSVFPTDPPRVTLAVVADLQQETLANQRTALPLLESLATDIGKLARSVDDGRAVLAELQNAVADLRNPPGSSGSTGTGKRRAG